MEADQPRDKLAIPGAEGWLRVTTTHGHVFYAHAPSKRSEWIPPAEIRERVEALEKALGIEEEIVVEPETPTELPVQHTEAEEPDGAGETTQQPQPEPVETFPELPPMTPEEAREAYLAMLTSLNGTPNEVNPMAPWDRELPKFVHQPMYRALPTIQDREDVFNEWCKLRVREKRAQRAQRTSQPRDHRSPEDVFRSLLKKVVLSTRTEYEAFRDTHKYDARFAALAEADEGRARVLFDAWLRELGELKRRLACEADERFIALLSERLAPPSAVRAEASVSLPLDKDAAAHIWATAKKTEGLVSDPRYDAVGSATRRAQLFAEWLSESRPAATLAATTSVPLPADAAVRDASDARSARRTAALEHREAQVRRERARLAQWNSAARHDVEAEQRENDFRQLLLDAVRDPWLSWNDAQALLARDARYAPAHHVRDLLSDAAKRDFFEEHVSRLRSRRRDQLARLFEKYAQDASGVARLDAPVETVLPLVRADDAFLQSGLPRFVGEDAGVHKTSTTTLESEYFAWDTWRQTQARAEFQDMLNENAFVDFWGRMRKEKEQHGEEQLEVPKDEEADEDDATDSLLDMASQLDLQAIESVLRVRTFSALLTTAGQAVPHVCACARPTDTVGSSESQHISN